MRKIPGPLVISANSCLWMPRDYASASGTSQAPTPPDRRHLARGRPSAPRPSATAARRSARVSTSAGRRGCVSQGPQAQRGAPLRRSDAVAGQDGFTRASDDHRPCPAPRSVTKEAGKGRPDGGPLRHRTGADTAGRLEPRARRRPGGRGPPRPRRRQRLRPRSPVVGHDPGAEPDASAAMSASAVTTSTAATSAHPVTAVRVSAAKARASRRRWCSGRARRDFARPSAFTGYDGGSRATDAVRHTKVCRRWPRG